MRASNLQHLIIIFVFCLKAISCANILMITMGGTKSHKIPFTALAKGLVERNHRITFVNGFKEEQQIDGLAEVQPQKLVNFIGNYTNWDLVGERLNGRMPLTLWQALRYPVEACNSLLSDPATIELLTQKFHLAIVDGAFPECALGIIYRMGITSYMYINTVGFYTGSLAIAGNPIVYAVTPHVFAGLTQRMHFLQRLQNCVTHIISESFHKYYTYRVHNVLQAYLGSAIPHPQLLSRNVSFILQNGHAAVTYARPLHPNTAEIACVHCRPAATVLPPELEEFIESAPTGVLFFSMGSSVRANNMPEEFRRLLIAVFARLPQYHVLWKWDDGNGNNNNNNNINNNGFGNSSSNATYKMAGIPSNVYLSGWLPQQDILGHRKLKAFITHGGLLSMYEAIYHIVPMVMLPVFCDHDTNAAKAAADGYAIHVPLEGITADRLYAAIQKILMQNEMYRRAIRQRRALLLDEMHSPLERAVFWTEYVLRHNGAEQLQATGRHMNFFIYHSLDVLLFVMAATASIVIILRKIMKYALKCLKPMPIKRD